MHGLWVRSVSDSKHVTSVATDTDRSRGTGIDPFSIN